MGRLVGKPKSVWKTAGSFTAGNKSVNNLLALFDGMRVRGSITGIWDMQELYKEEAADDWIDNQLASTARAQTGGSMSLNSVSLGDYDYTYVAGDENITSFSNGNYFTTTQDSKSALVYIDGDMTVASGQTFIPSHRKIFTAIYVSGNLAVNGSISMTARGCNHSPGGSPRSAGNIKLIADGTYSSVPNPQIPSSGGSAGAASAEAHSSSDQQGGTGGAGSSGGTGGGGGGGAGVGGANPGGYSGRAKGGVGAAGSSFSGGPGGGGATDLTNGPIGPGNKVGFSGVSNGGAGGAAGNGPSHYDASGGTGNPGGQGKDADGNNPGTNGTDGTGGILVIYVEGNYTGSGTVVAQGTKGHGEGGSSGGGSISIFVKGTDSGPTPSAAGGVQATVHAIDGAYGGAGGAGTARKMAYT
jgi:hypothetical protein